MASVITMPRLSPTMEEGVLLKWTKKEGDQIAPGDVIAEVETDKANMDFPLEDEGTLLKLLVKEGETVKLGAPVAVLGEPGEDAASALAAIAGTTKAAPAAPKKDDSARPTAKETGGAGQRPDKGNGHGGGTVPGTDLRGDEARVASDRDVGETQPRDVTAVEPEREEAAQNADSKRSPQSQKSSAIAESGGAARVGQGVGAVRASPLARRLAFEQGLDLKSVKGSGPGGRVVKRDVEQAAGASAQATDDSSDAANRPSAKAEAARGRGDQTIALSPMRRTIARRLTESKATVPHFYVTMDAQADALWAFHQQVKEAAEVKITLNDLVLKAVAVALSRLPEANASWTDAGLVRHGAVHLGVAVSIDDGLVTPVIRDADTRSLGAIAKEARDLVERARARKLRGDEFTGSTFSISNMGMLGVKSFSAVINPPDAGILAVGAIEKRAVVVSAGDADRIEARRVMTLTLSADHRVIDGALAAKLLAEIVKILERPFQMVL